MKTRKQKVICRVLCMVVSILLLASFFVVPVSAEVDQLNQVQIDNIEYSPGGDPHDPEQRPYSSFRLTTEYGNKLSDLNNTASFHFGDPEVSTTKYGDLVFYAPDLPDEKFFGVYYINQLFDDYVFRTFKKGDTFFIESGFITCEIGSDSKFTAYRFTLRSGGEPYEFSFNRVVASTATVSIDYDSSETELEYERLAFTFSDDIYSNDLCLCVEFAVEHDDSEFKFIMGYDTYNIKYGSGVSPNYPIYPSAPGKDKIDGFGSAEQEVIQSQESAIVDGVNNILTGEVALNDLEVDLELVSFSAHLIKIMDRLNLIPGIDPIIQISLSLGLLASFLSLAGSIISAADRKVGQAKREAQRESRTMDKK